MKNGKGPRKKPFRRIMLLCAIITYLCIRVNVGKTSNTNKIDNGNDNNIQNDIYKSVVIDAGSTGTRVHIYNYKIVNHEKDISIYIPSTSYRTTPGLVYLLNNYFTNDEKEPFYEYFKNIKEFLHEHITERERSNTPILVRASGGFRLLSITESENYINFIKKYLLTNFKEFLLIDELLIKVLSGKEEAILSFVSIYALLEIFKPNPLIFANEQEEYNEMSNGTNSEHAQMNNDSEKTVKLTNGIISSKGNHDSIGVLELGGATAQIVIKIPLSKMNDDVKNLFNYKHKENINKSVIEENYKNKNIVKIHLLGNDLYLYCKSYLVLGRQNAMKTYLHYIIHKHNEEDQVREAHETDKKAYGRGENQKHEKKNQMDLPKFIPVACFPKNFKFYVNNLYETSIEEELHEYDGKSQVSEKDYIAVGTGNIDLCRTQVQTILKYALIDNLPFKLKKFIKLYAIENFHHFAIDILNIPESFNPISLNSNVYLEKAKQICPLTIDEIVKMVRPGSNIEKAQTSCFGLIFIYEFMRHILKIDTPIMFHSTNYINKISITWTIAVLLMELPRHLHLIKKQEKEPYQNDEL
ncbi:nucleoside-diphosphatase mig-23 [Plasmodium gonderi]|uniref:Nucleoside-diphosphatase mig-23 n=1 Tax=Plasmodium gonderi TaxID=77519 RepID=A0A1Y1JPJ0_PLAGO|nr:nucleoside-diphosphatase mig-23 [Plasmodium gonderi]GAW82343.1 nucleoside-diphosphatase mig-23 [Plasmodium gonderi]